MVIIRSRQGRWAVGGLSFDLGDVSDSSGYCDVMLLLFVAVVFVLFLDFIDCDVSRYPKKQICIYWESITSAGTRTTTPAKMFSVLI